MLTLTRETVKNFLPATVEEIELHFNIVKHSQHGYYRDMNLKSKLISILNGMLNRNEIRRKGNYFEPILVSKQ